MYQSQTYETILANMLAAVPNNIDKGEGSIIYDALAPAAAQLSQAYVSLDNVLTLVFANTTNGSYLDQRVSEYGLTRKPATAAVKQGTFNMPVPVGARFFINNLYYDVNSDPQVTVSGTTTANLVCETIGSIGNGPTGTMLPITNIVGLTTATLGNTVTAGVDVETDTALYTRFLQKVQTPATSGNQAQYVAWTESVTGVGGAKVFPLWNGAGTVKVVIIDSNGNPASDTLVSTVQNYLSPNPGTGEGVAPIGANVTVAAATPQLINVTATVVLDSVTSLTTAQTNISNAIGAYIQSIAFKDDTIRYTKIMAAIGSAQGVLDYSNVTVNGGTSNVVITDAQIPMLGTVTVSE